ncbi:MAG: hypothetical protein JST04_13020 [Bdellovibrionales bacterium]|nr:hypothetical protein [Bdellovibrionales bacterium]
MRGKGTCFRRLATLGRQQIFFRPSELVPSLKETGFSIADVERFLDTARDTGSADPLFQLLGAEEVVSLDASDYQGATIRHDLNLPVDVNLHDRFDVVFDGGTLEHVFNFPVAIRNAMEMIAVGGSLVSVTPANNQMGHGFYQFSPELFYNVLSPANGFRVAAMVALELSPANRWFEVENPARIRSRVTLTNLWGVNLFVHAIRDSKKEIFATTPQQSDYTVLWGEGTRLSSLDIEPGQAAGRDLKENLSIKLRRKFPGAVYLMTSVAQIFQSSFGFRNTKFFRRLVG